MISTIKIVGICSVPKPFYLETEMFEN